MLPVRLSGMFFVVSSWIFVVFVFQLCDVLACVTSSRFESARISGTDADADADA